MCTTVLHGPGITADADASDPVVITILKPFCIQLINWVKFLSLARSKCSHVLHKVSLVLMMSTALRASLGL